MKINRFFAGLDISADGLTAQRKRMNAIASNIANIDTTRTEEGGPYRRKIVLLKAQAQQAFSNVLRSAGLGLSATDNSHFADVFGGGSSLDTPLAGVAATETTDNSPFKTVFDPGNPDADANGYVQTPNVNVVTEMVDMISASRSYEANVTAVNAAKTMAKDALEI